MRRSKSIFSNPQVTITTRQLISHKSGIRHYKLNDPQKKNNKKGNCAQTNDDSKVGSQTINDKGKGAPTVSAENDKTSKKEESLEERTDVSTESKMKNEKTAVTISSDNETAYSNKDVKEKESKNENRRSSCGNRVPRRKNKKKKDEEEDEFDLKEYYIKEEFETVSDALKLFQDDELFFKPGE